MTNLERILPMDEPDEETTTGNMRIDFFNFMEMSQPEEGEGDGRRRSALSILRGSIFHEEDSNDSTYRSEDASTEQESTTDMSDEDDWVEERPRFERCRAPAEVSREPDLSRIENSDLRYIIETQSGWFRNEKAANLPGYLKDREIGNRRKKPRMTDISIAANRANIGSCILPNKRKKLDQYTHKAFCGSYSKEGDFFMSSSQDHMIRMYDTSRDNFQLTKTFRSQQIGWSVLDTDISPDGRHFTYSGWSPCLFLCPIQGQSDKQECLYMTTEDEGHFCIFSAKFSSNGAEIVGGSNLRCLYVYDLEAQKRCLKIRGHKADVNAVAFADQSSHILFSASDDGLVKVWDRRSLQDKVPVGVFVGHTHGINHIDSRGDARHLITSSKDQTIKLWDMRMFSPEESVAAAVEHNRNHLWDYRWDPIPHQCKLTPSNCETKNKLSVKVPRKQITGDTSLMTYRGHTIKATLIRCRFSPSFTTGQSYIYTGCGNGKVVIYDVLTGEIVKVLPKHTGVVRDVSWHPYYSNLISSDWSGEITQWYYADENSLEDGDSKPLRRSVRIQEKRRTASESGESSR